MLAEPVEHFVTLFNSLFLPQGLALHMSMERHVQAYVLWILCVDDETYEVLGRLDLPNVRRLKLSDLETPELLDVKPGRTIGEYCWTLTPFAPRFVFEADSSVERVTYIDADLWFRKHPKPLFNELNLSGKHVLITDHAYAPENDQSVTCGVYCVQFMTFIRGRSERVRKWWEDRCIEWCFARFEDGKFGDQKYLDDWPQRFSNVVHVLRDKELALGPWNASRFPWSSAVFYHFHGLRLLSKNRVEIGHYFLPNELRLNIYKNYFSDFRKAIAQLEEIGMDVAPQAESIIILRSRYIQIKRVKTRFLPLLVNKEQKF